MGLFGGKEKRVRGGRKGFDIGGGFRERVASCHMVHPMPPDSFELN